MLEIEEIFEQIVKAQGVTKDDCAEAQARFKYAFLTIDSKEEFLPFLSGYANRLSEALGSEDERVSALRQEIEGFYHKIPELISLYHLAGFKDPNDKDDSRALSEDIDDSFEEARKIGKMSNLLNFQIPEEKKPLVTKVLQSIAVLSDQKKATRVQLFTKWRYLYLAQKIDAYRIYVPALFTIQKFCARRFNFFYRLKQAVLAPERKEYEDMSVGHSASMVDASEGVKARSANEMSEQGVLFQKITKVKQVKTVRESASMASVGDTDFTELTERLKEREEYINSLHERIRVLEESDHMNGGSDAHLEESEARIRSLTDKVVSLEAQILELTSDNDAKRQLLNDHVAQLLSQREMVERLSNELRQLKKEQSKDSLGRFGKVRFMAKVLRNLTQKFLQSGLNRMLKRSVRTIDAIQNVSLRMKARLLDQTRSLHCGKDMHRNFLKWFIRTDKSFLKELFTKILINCRITNNTAFYRMKKMAFRPQRVKLSDAMKLLYRCKGSLALHNLFNNRMGSAMKHFFDTINPHKKTRGEAAIERLLLHRVPAHVKSAKKQVMNKLMKRLALEKRTIHTLSGFWKLKERKALDHLRSLVKHQTGVAKLARVRRGLELLERLVARRQRDFVDRLKKMGGRSLAQRLEKLANAGRFKQLSALAKFRKNLVQKQLEKKTADFASDVIDLRRRGLAQLLASSLRKKMYQTLTELRLFNEAETKIAERRRQLGQRVMLNLNERIKFLKAQTLKKLRAFRQGVLASAKKRQVVLSLLDNSLNQKKTAALRRLIDNMDAYRRKETIQKAVLAKILNLLTTRSRVKQEKAYKTLIKNLKAARKRQMEIQQKLGGKLLAMKDALTRGALQKLKRNVQDHVNSKLRQEKVKGALKKLADGPKTSLMGALSMLRTNSKAAAAKDARRQTKALELIKRLKAAQQAKAAQALKNMRDALMQRRSADERRNRKLENLLQTLQKKNKEKVAKAISQIRTVHQNAKVRDGRRAEMQKKLLANLAARADQKKKQALQRLVQNNRFKLTEDQKKRAKLNKLLERLRNATRIKAQTAVNKLKALKDAKSRKEAEHNRKLKALMAQMARKATDRSRLVMDKLKANRVNQDQKLANIKRKTNNFMNFLLRSEDKRRVALNKLRAATAALALSQIRKMDKIRNAINRIVTASRHKQERTVFLLTSLFSRARFQEDLDKLRKTFTSSNKDRRRRGLLMLLVSSQTGKMLNAMNNLVRWTNQSRLADAKKRERHRTKIQRLIDALNAKTDIALQRLINNNNVRRALDREQAARDAKMKSMFGTSPEDREAAQFQSLIRDLKQARNRPRDYGFDSLSDFMKENNRRGKFDPLLDLINRGLVGNTKELLDRATAENTDGRYNDLIDRINDRNRAAKDVKGFMKAANSDGKLSKLAGILDKNPKLTKADIIDYVAKNGKDPSFDKLKAYLNGNKRIEDMAHWMRKNNADGQYEKVLAYLRRLKDPKTTDLVHIVSLDKGPHVDPLKAKLAEEDKAMTVPKLMQDIKKANDKGQYTPLLDFAAKERVPTLSDLVGFMKANNADGRYTPFLDSINNKKTDPVLADLIGRLEDRNSDGKLDDLIKHLKANPNAKLSDVFAYVAKNNSDGKLDKAADLLNDSNPADKYIKFMRDNNGDGRYKDLLADFEGVDDPKLTDLIAKAGQRNVNGKIKPLFDKINNEEPTNPVRRYVRNRMENLDYAPLRRFLDNNPDLTMTEVANFVQRNNRDGKLNPIVDVINHHNKKPNAAKMIDAIGRRNINGKYDPLLAEINQTRKPRATQIYNAIAKQNADGKLDPVLRELNTGNGTVQDNFADMLESDNADGKHNDLLRQLRGKKQLTPAEIVALLKAANKPVASRVFDLLNLFANQVDYMNRNNDDGLYASILGHLHDLENPKLHDLLQKLVEDNADNRFDTLLNKIDTEFPKKRLRAFLNSDTERYASLIKALEDDTDMMIHDFLAKVIEENDDGIYDAVIALIDGDTAPRTVGDLLQWIEDNNQSGKFDPVLEKISKIQDPTLTQLIGEVLAANSNHQLDDLLDYFNAKDRGPLSEAMNLMRNNNNDGRYNALLEKIAAADDFNITDLMDLLANHPNKSKMADLIDLLDNKHARNLYNSILEHMFNNNADGKFNPLLADIAAGKAPSLFDLANLIKAHNPKGELNELIDILDENPKDRLVKDILAYAKDNNKDGRFSEFLEAMRAGGRQPKLTDIVPYIAARNEDERFDPILDMINGNSFPVSRLLEFLMDNNKDGKYNDLINMIKNDPELPLSKILEAGRKYGPNSELDRFLKFLGEGPTEADGPEDDDDDLFKFLANARKKNQYPEVIKAIEEEGIKSTPELVDYLKKNNKDGRFNPLIEKVLHFKKVSDAKAAAQPVEEPKGMSFLRPCREKMRICLTKLRQVAREEAMKRRMRLLKVASTLGRLGLKSNMKKTNALATLRNILSGERDKFKTKQGKLASLFKRLADRSKVKEVAAFKLLTDNARRKQGKLANFAAKLVSAQDKKKALVLAGLRRNANIVKRREDGKFKLASMLANKQKQRMVGTIQNLQRERVVAAANEAVDKARKNNALNRLSDWLRQGMKRGLDTLRDNAKRNLTKELKIQNSAKLLANKLAGASALKEVQAIQNIKQNSHKVAASKADVEAKSKFVFGKWKDRGNAVLRLAFNSLRANRQLMIAQQNQKERTRQALKFMEAQLAKNRKSDLARTLQSLKDNKLKTKRQEESRKEALRRLASKFDSLSHANAADAFKRLTNNHRLANQAHSKRQAIIERLLKRLQGATKEKTSKTVNALRQNNSQIKTRKALKQADLRRLLTRIGDKNKLKTATVFQKLRENNRQSKVSTAKRTAALAKLEELIRRKNKEGVSSAFSSIKAIASRRSMAEKRKNDAIRKLLEQLTDKTRSKARQFITSTQRQIQAAKSKSLVQNARLKGILSRLMRKKIIMVMEKLIINNLHYKMRTLKHRLVACKTNGAQLVKSAVTVSKLRNFAVVNKLKMRYNATVFNALISNMVRNRKASVFSELSQKLLKAASRREAAARFIRKTLVEKERQAFSKLRDLVVVARRNKFNNALSSMMFCLKKNHKACMRSMLDVWSRKELKQKTSRLSSVINNLITKRTAAAMAKVKQEYNMWKYRKVLKALLGTMEKVDLLQNNKKRKALRDMYNMFIDSNPWFKKVISILTMNTKLTDQVSFWRMRHVKNLKRESVSPMMAIKMKKFLAVFKKQENKNLNYGFWNLTKILDQGLRNSTLSATPRDTITSTNGRASGLLNTQTLPKTFGKK
jgi:hypothetical protein